MMKEVLGMPHFPEEDRIAWDEYWTIDSTISKDYDIVYYYIEKDD